VEIDVGDGRDQKPTVAIIMPVFNEATQLEASLEVLYRCDVLNEVIVVDGGSDDPTDDVIRRFIGQITEAESVFRFSAAPRSRALQMNAGALLAQSDVLLFLHVDARLPDSAMDSVRDSIRRGASWGRFDMHLDDDAVIFRIIEWCMNMRSTLTGIATGDQAIFVRRDVFRMLGGYAPIRLMEDVEFCKRLKWVGPPALIAKQVRASTRRWRQHGIVRTVILMWFLRLLYWLGISPKTVARFYPDTR
jgi:rSAM/selenodomain-associated transferase 2